MVQLTATATAIVVRGRDEGKRVDGARGESRGQAHDNADRGGLTDRDRDAGNTDRGDCTDYG